MNKNDKKKLIANIAIENSNVTRNLPIFEGDVIVFDGESENFTEEVPEDTTNHISAWTRINGRNGAMSASQLLRRGNGLNLEGDNNTDRLQNLLSSYTEDGELVFTIYVREIRTRGERNYYILDVMAGEHTAEDFA